MVRPVPLLVGAALALVALGGYDVLRGDPRAAVVGPAPAAAPLALSAARLPLGEVVTSAGGALYRYDQDTADPTRSNCVGQCAATWPPLLTSGGPLRLTGIDPALIGIVLRPDGTEQLTLAGWPLYRYSGDTAPGQTLGEGRSGAWHAVGPTGKPTVARPGEPTVARPGKSGVAKVGKHGTTDGSGAGPVATRPAPQPTFEPAPEPDPAPSGGGYGY